jgi:hypothetical protein
MILGIGAGAAHLEGPTGQARQVRTTYRGAMRVPTSLLSAGSLVAGYAVAAGTGSRPLGGLVLAAGGAVCTREWARQSGNGTAAALLTTFVAAFGLSHPLAKQIGAWPSVLTVAAVTALVAHLASDRPAALRSPLADRLPVGRGA